VIAIHVVDIKIFTICTSDNTHLNFEVCNSKPRDFKKVIVTIADCDLVKREI